MGEIWGEIPPHRVARCGIESQAAAPSNSVSDCFLGRDPSTGLAFANQQNASFGSTRSQVRILSPRLTFQGMAPSLARETARGGPSPAEEVPPVAFHSERPGHRGKHQALDDPHVTLFRHEEFDVQPLNPIGESGPRCKSLLRGWEGAFTMGIDEPPSRTTQPVGIEHQAMQPPSKSIPLPSTDRLQVRLMFAVANDNVAKRGHNKARSSSPGPLPAQPWCLPRGAGRSCAVG
jgi:hypothetical protein